MVDSGRVGNVDAERALLESAFQDAAHATWLVRLRSENTGGLVDDTQGFSHQAADGLGVDRLSLQCRALSRLTKIDPQLARRLFGTIRVPEIRHAACGADGVDDPGAYFDTAALLTRSGPAGHRSYLDLTAHVTSSMQIRPTTYFLSQAAVSCDYLRRSLAALTQQLAAVDDGDREFSAASRYHALGDALNDVTAFCRRCKLSDAEFEQALVAFVRNHLAETRCSDDLSSRVHQEADADLIRTLAARPGVLLPASVPVPSHTILVPRRAASSEFLAEPVKSALDRLRQLIFRVGPIRYTPFERRSVEWQAGAQALFETIRLWSPDDWRDEATYFHCRLDLLTELAALTPKGQLQSELVKQLTEDLASAPGLGEAPGDWLQHILFVLDAGGDPEARETVRYALSTSPSPVLRVYAMLGSETTTR
ncbi:MAG TPA: hypothetical protein VN924_28930 [Bryobacteraceae bacterium]|nr:hypothetical protein [Bryobacteraceae bacterium]